MPRRLPPTVLVLVLLAAASAQGSNGWRVESEFDPYSYLGRGSLSLPAAQAPSDLPPGDALLVVGCDPAGPLGVEITAWIAPAGHYSLGDDIRDVTVLVRFDMQPVVTQYWFLTEGFFATEAVVRYEHNEALVSGLMGAKTMALRIQADPARGVEERTLQYDVRGFETAFAELRCDGTERAAPGMADDGPLQVGDWTFDGLDGMVTAGPTGSLALYCAATDSGDANGVEIEVGDYALAAPAYDLVFRSGNVDFLRTTASLNAFAAAQLDGDDVEDRLVRFLRGVIDVTVTLTPTTGGDAMAITVPTRGFSEALARLGCYTGGR